jgi:hypothetical protein
MNYWKRILQKHSHRTVIMNTFVSLPLWTIAMLAGSRVRRVVLGALVAFLATGMIQNTGAAVQYSAQVLVDTEFEFSGIWSARVGYFDGKPDDAGRVMVHGVLPGSTFLLVAADPFHSVSVALYDAVLSQGDALTFEGAWHGEDWGSAPEVLEGFEYVVGGAYTHGGFNEPMDPEGTPTDSMWGYWDGTFSIRQIGLGTPVPEPGTAVAILGLGLGLIVVRRQRAV